MIDIHSHILPGVDDGARTLTDSVEIVRELMMAGVTDVVATPHYIIDTNYVSSRFENLQIFERLKQVVADEGLKINLYLGNEIYIDNEILQLLKKNTISTMAGSRYLLVELPLNEEFPNYQDVFLELMNEGYKVILAHPERYAIVQNNYEVMEELSEMGVLLQCNLGSIVGKYGSGAKKVIKRLAKEKRIFALGSDIHHAGRGEYLRLGQKKLAKYYSEAELGKILVRNARRIIAG